MEKIPLVCKPSKKDKRTIKHSDLSQASEPLIQGGYDYLPQDIENQHTVGICTAISMIQNREKANGKKYSPEFQYFLQKTFIDGDWTEGSSVLSALQVAKKYGFLPAELWTHSTEADRTLPYSEYIKKLQLTLDETNRLIALCVDKISGYASVDVSDPQAMALAINESESGIQCRIVAGPTWWTGVNGVSSWNPTDINPLRKPTTNLSGHAICIPKFDYTTVTDQTIANTWGTSWNKQGLGDIIWNMYAPTEAWLILKYNPMFQFNNDMKLGSRLSPDVKNLQQRLNMPTLFCTGYFGIITYQYVKNWQKAHNLKPDGIFGILSRGIMNQ